MIESVLPHDLVFSFAASALIVLFGAGYAGLFAWSRIAGGNGWLSFAAGLCYLALAAAVLGLARLAHFDGPWLILTGLMLAGYCLAPLGIWRLCLASHQHETGQAAKADGAKPDHEPSASPSRIHPIHSKPGGTPQ